MSYDGFSISSDSEMEKGLLIIVQFELIVEFILI